MWLGTQQTGGEDEWNHAAGRAVLLSCVRHQNALKIKRATGRRSDRSCARSEKRLTVGAQKYRLTPHSTTGVSPSSICIQREVRDTIPHVGNTTMKQKQVETKLRNRHIHNERISRKRRARMRHLKAGNVVLVKNRHPDGKFKTPFEPELWTVARVKGTLETAMRKDETVTRNISWFKLYHGKPLESERTEVNSGLSSFDEGGLLNGPFQASGELDERDTTSLKVPERSEERITAEVPSAIIRRGGMDSYSLRPCISAPEKLKDYVRSELDL
ncbi:hypothetical protein NDU88_004974 [Pleurodeles waltl]|uniref:Uncharacterized protein n=1 Tax=Pleurodeles waltl TaxID=8319 RepID=A0AAV7SKH1_PLEWA|nr:hypothetical protein NDU88_004974 [Pleurodeles waltl]